MILKFKKFPKRLFKNNKVQITQKKKKKNYIKLKILISEPNYVLGNLYSRYYKENINSYKI